MKIMNLTINKKDYELKFGLDFINFLDKKYYIEQDGFKLGQGLTYVVLQAELGNPLILLDLIMAATVTSAKVKIDDVKVFVENEADINELMNEFLVKLEETPITRFTMSKLGLVSKPKKK